MYSSTQNSTPYSTPMTAINETASDREAAQSAPLVPMLELLFVVVLLFVVLGLVLFAVPLSVVLELPELVEPETSLEGLDTTAEAEAAATVEAATTAESVAEPPRAEEVALESGSDAARELCEGGGERRSFRRVGKG
jgi:hypothetical protein